MGVFAYIKNGVKYKNNQFPGAYPASRVSYNGSDVESALDNITKAYTDITALSTGWTGTVSYLILGKMMFVAGAITASSTMSGAASVVLQLPSVYPKRFSVQRARKTSDGNYVDFLVHTNGQLVIQTPTASESYQFNFAFMIV